MAASSGSQPKAPGSAGVIVTAAVERKNKSLMLQGKQDYLMSIMLGEEMHLRDKAGGTFMIRFKGAIDLPSKESEEDED